MTKIDKEKAMGLVDQVNWLRRRAEGFRAFAASNRKLYGQSDKDAKLCDEEADRLEIKAQFMIEDFFFPERFAAVQADAEEAARS